MITKELNDDMKDLCREVATDIRDMVRDGPACEHHTLEDTLRRFVLAVLSKRIE